VSDGLCELLTRLAAVKLDPASHSVEEMTRALVERQEILDRLAQLELSTLAPPARAAAAAALQAILSTDAATVGGINAKRREIQQASTRSQSGLRALRGYRSGPAQRGQAPVRHIA